MKTAIQSLFDDEGAVSPVIGVILMVAITVILAAVIGTFVLGLGGQVSQTAPQASISVDSVSGTEVTFRHGGSDDITFSELEIAISGANSGTYVLSEDTVWSTAQTFTLDIGGNSITSYSGTGTTPGIDSGTVGASDGDGQHTATFVDEPSGQIIAEKEFEI